MTLTIEDDETQTYDLTVDDDADPKEGGSYHCDHQATLHTRTENLTLHS